VSGRQINRVDKIIEGYRILRDKENMLYALSTKYELLSFSGRNAEAEFTISEIAGLIKEYDLNALIGVHDSLESGDLKYNKFMNSFVKQMKAIYRVAKNSGIGKYFTQPLSLDMLEFADKDTKWLDSDTFEFEFPESC
jgi:hypothetical protein